MNIRTHLRTTLVLLLLCACSSDESSLRNTPDSPPASSDDAMASPSSDTRASDSTSASPDDAMASPSSDTRSSDRGADPEDPACSTDTPALCTYVPERPLTSLDATMGPLELSYEDATGDTRTFSYEVRLPAGADDSTPIVLWSHGGASGKTNPSQVANDLGKILVEAGYVMVAIAHHPRPFDTYEELCKAIGQTEAQCQGIECSADDDCTAFEQGTCGGGRCRYFKPLNWDRPNDVKALIDVIADPDGPVATQADISKIVYAGHSAGAGSALMIAGAVRQYGDVVHLLHDTRPIAFISGSPQGPVEAGFIPSSYTGEGCVDAADDASYCLTRPHLIMTGAGDDTSGTVAEDRREAYTRLPGTDKYLIWNTEEAARHTTFELKPDSCEGYTGPGAVDAERCQTYVTWLQSAVIAFLDAYTRDDALAKAYLASDNVVTLSAGAVEWLAK